MIDNEQADEDDESQVKGVEHTEGVEDNDEGHVEDVEGTEGVDSEGTKEVGTKEVEDKGVAEGVKDLIGDVTKFCMESVGICV